MSGRRFEALWAVAAVPQFVSVLLPWTNDGAGSGLPAHEVADLALSGTASMWLPRWFGFLLYAPAAAGCFLLLSFCLTGRGQAVLRGSAAMLGLAAAVFVLQRAHALDPERLALGGWLSLAPVLCLLAMPRWARRISRRGSHELSVV